MVILKYKIPCINCILLAVCYDRCEKGRDSYYNIINSCGLLYEWDISKSPKDYFVYRRVCNDIYNYIKNKGMVEYGEKTKKE